MQAVWLCSKTNGPLQCAHHALQWGSEGELYQSNFSIAVCISCPTVCTSCPTGRGGGGGGGWGLDQLQLYITTPTSQVNVAYSWDICRQWNDTFIPIFSIISSQFWYILFFSKVILTHGSFLSVWFPDSKATPRNPNRQHLNFFWINTIWALIQKWFSHMIQEWFKPYS